MNFKFSEVITSENLEEMEMKNRIREIEQYLGNLPFEVKKKRNENIYYFNYKGANGNWIVFLEFNSKAQSITFYAQLKEKILEEKMNILQNFLNQCNFVVPIGCFALDEEMGTLNYKVVQKYYMEISIVVVIEDMINIGLRIIDDYMAGIKVLLESEIDTSIAMKKIYEEQESYDIFIL